MTEAELANLQHRTVLRALAYAVLCDAILEAQAWVRIRRTFVLSFRDDDTDVADDGDGDASVAKPTVKMPVIPTRGGAQQAQARRIS